MSGRLRASAKGLLLDTDKTPADAGEDIARKLEEALALARSGNPVLLNCFIARSSFREGSLSVWAAHHSNHFCSCSSATRLHATNTST